MQKAFSFDRETVGKIVRGMVHAVLVAAILGGLDYALQVAQMVESNNILVTMGLSWFSATGYNAIREWAKGL